MLSWASKSPNPLEACSPEERRIADTARKAAEGTSGGKGTPSAAGS